MMMVMIEVTKDLLVIYVSRIVVVAKLWKSMEFHPQELWLKAQMGF